MMREKVAVYKQYAANLLGDAELAFIAPWDQTATEPADPGGISNQIDEALFISFKRLFSRDQIKRETFAARIYRSGVLDGYPGTGVLVSGTDDPGMNNGEAQVLQGYTGSNVYRTSTSGSAIFSDIGASSNVGTSFGGGVGDILNASNTAECVGLMFYDAGTAVFDMKKLFFWDQHMSGAIRAMATANTVDGATIATGYSVMGASASNGKAQFIPDFLVSGSIDQIVDHVASTRFQSGSLTAATFQNATNINSTLIFCRATADEFNYSSNPTFTDNSNRITVIDQATDNQQRSFTFPTTVGLHDEFGNLLAVAKMSRPIEKNDEKDITFRIRLDF